MARVRETMEGFLSRQWKEGVLEGRAPGEAFSVRCDRGTMTQKEIDEGRLVCLVGVATRQPGEFAVFRIERKLRTCS